jgi:hypothetical protein
MKRKRAIHNATKTSKEAVNGKGEGRMKKGKRRYASESTSHLLHPQKE